MARAAQSTEGLFTDAVVVKQMMGVTMASKSRPELILGPSVAVNRVGGVRKDFGRSELAING